MNQVHQRKRSSTCSIAAECSWPGRMSTPPPVGQTSQRWQGKRRRRSRRSCRANHPRRRRQDKIALSPSGGSGSTGCGAGCSSRQWRGRWSRRSRRLHRGQSQLQPQLPGSFAPSVESKFVLINTFPTSFDIFLKSNCDEKQLNLSTNEIIDIVDCSPPLAQCSAIDLCEGCTLRIQNGSQRDFLRRLQTNKPLLPGE